MNIYLMLAIGLANIIAIAMIYQFIKKLDNKNKIIFMAASVAIMYALVSLVYWISGFGIEEKIHNNMKNFITYLFVPVNLILFVPYFASQYMKVKENELKVEKFAKKLSTLVVILIIVLIIEFFYFRNVQNNVNNIAENMVQNSLSSNTENTIKNQENEINETITNDVVSNIIQNEIISNQID